MIEGINITLDLVTWGKNVSVTNLNYVKIIISLY